MVQISGYHGQSRKGIQFHNWNGKILDILKIIYYLFIVKKSFIGSGNILIFLEVKKLDSRAAIRK
jgi:hypothetical protein